MEADIMRKVEVKYTVEFEVTQEFVVDYDADILDITSLAFSEIENDSIGTHCGLGGIEYFSIEKDYDDEQLEFDF